MRVKRDKGSNMHWEKRETGKRGGRENQPTRRLNRKAKSVMKYINMPLFFLEM